MRHRLLQILRLHLGHSRKQESVRDVHERGSDGRWIHDGLGVLLWTFLESRYLVLL